MDNKQENKTALPFPAMLLIAAIMAGGVIKFYAPLDSLRPPHDERMAEYQEGEEKVLSRMWQDPFHAVDEHLKRFQVSQKSIKFSPTIAGINYIEDINNKFLILPVIVTAGKYAEDIEWRLRSRYAILSALHVAGYRSENASHIGVFSINEISTEPDHEEEMNPDKKKIYEALKVMGVDVQKYTKLSNDEKEKYHNHMVPYEWFVFDPLEIEAYQRFYSNDKEGPYDKVLILWLGDDYFHGNRLIELSRLYKHVQKKINEVINVIKVDLINEEISEISNIRNILEMVVRNKMGLEVDKENRNDVAKGNVADVLYSLDAAVQNEIKIGDSIELKIKGTKDSIDEALEGLFQDVQIEVKLAGNKIIEIVDNLKQAKSSINNIAKLEPVIDIRFIGPSNSIILEKLYTDFKNIYLRNKSLEESIKGSENDLKKVTREIDGLSKTYLKYITQAKSVLNNNRQKQEVKKTQKTIDTVIKAKFNKDMKQSHANRVKEELEELNTMIFRYNNLLIRKKEKITNAIEDINKAEVSLYSVVQSDVKFNEAKDSLEWIDQEYARFKKNRLRAVEDKVDFAEKELDGVKSGYERLQEKEKIKVAEAENTVQKAKDSWELIGQEYARFKKNRLQPVEDKVDFEEKKLDEVKSGYERLQEKEEVKIDKAENRVIMAKESLELVEHENIRFKKNKLQPAESRVDTALDKLKNVKQNSEWFTVNTEQRKKVREAKHIVKKAKYSFELVDQEYARFKKNKLQPAEDKVDFAEKELDEVKSGYERLQEKEKIKIDKAENRVIMAKESLKLVEHENIRFKKKKLQPSEDKVSFAQKELDGVKSGYEGLLEKEKVKLALKKLSYLGYEYEKFGKTLRKVKEYEDKLGQMEIFYNEIVEDRDSLMNKGGVIRDFIMFSPWATAEPLLLTSRENSLDNTKITTVRGYVDALKTDKRGFDIGAKNFKFNLYNSIHTDQYITDELVAELGRRGVQLETDGKDHIVLISEWDTFYGRALPLSFAISIESHRGKNKPSNNKSWPERIHKISYMRGIDGMLPLGNSDSDIQVKKGSGFRKSSRNLSNMEYQAPEFKQPLGQAQFDYIRRLVSKIKQFSIDSNEHYNGKVRAIGVLGSDIYDKLLILRALRSEFPNVIFFTNDMDALLYHKTELKWTKNLIVASSYGLQLHPDIQNNIPPFRTVYQSSAFVATLQATGVMENIDFKQYSPRIYEIGRRGPYDITPNIVKAEFFHSEFVNLSVENLCKKIEADIKPKDVIMIEKKNTIAWLNELLDKPDLHKILKNNVDNVIMRKIYFIANKLHIEKDYVEYKIKKLNRSMIENKYSDFTPKIQDRNKYLYPERFDNWQNIWKVSALKYCASYFIVLFCFPLILFGLLFYGRLRSMNKVVSSTIGVDNVFNWSSLLTRIQEDTKKLLPYKLKESNQLERIQAINDNELSDERKDDLKDEIIAVFNAIKDNLSFYKDEVVGKDIKLSSDVKFEFNNLKGVLKESGELEKKESDLSDSQKEDIKWFNIAILKQLFPHILSKSPKPNSNQKSEGAKKDVQPSDDKTDKQNKSEKT